MRTIATLWLGAALVACASSCSQSDVGAPCQHAGGDVPTEPLISFPALACDQLLCVFGESFEPPVTPCERASDCAQISGTEDYACESGRCVVAQDTVLQRSMCSATCVSDADCADPVEGTQCRSGFSCAPLMSLGEFCCQKVCVCRDDLDVAAAEDLEAACALGDVPGCCDQDPVPQGCL